jgi:hypothetical protein
MHSWPSIELLVKRDGGKIPIFGYDVVCTTPHLPDANQRAAQSQLRGERELIFKEQAGNDSAKPPVAAQNWHTGSKTQQDGVRQGAEDHDD